MLYYQILWGEVWERSRTCTRTVWQWWGVLQVWQRRVEVGLHQRSVLLVRYGDGQKRLPETSTECDDEKILENGAIVQNKLIWQYVTEIINISSTTMTSPHYWTWRLSQTRTDGSQLYLTRLVWGQINERLVAPDRPTAVSYLIWMKGSPPSSGRLREQLMLHAKRLRASAHTIDSVCVGSG